MDYLPAVPTENPALESQIRELRRSLAADEFATAVANADRMIELCSTDAVASQNLADLFVLRGVAQYLRGNVGAAIADYSLAIQHDNVCWLAYFHRWQCHRLLKNFDAAEKDKEVGRKLAPPRVQILYDEEAGII